MQQRVVFHPRVASGHGELVRVPDLDAVRPRRRAGGRPERRGDRSLLRQAQADALRHPRAGSAIRKVAPPRDVIISSLPNATTSSVQVLGRADRRLPAISGCGPMPSIALIQGIVAPPRPDPRRPLICASSTAATRSARTRGPSMQTHLGVRLLRRRGAERPAAAPGRPRGRTPSGGRLGSRPARGARSSALSVGARRRGPVPVGFRGRGFRGSAGRRPRRARARAIR